MRFQNPVKSHAAPWFIDEAETARQLPRLPDPAAMDAPWEYAIRDQRHFVAHAQVDFAHQEIFPAHTFKQP